MQKYIFCLFTTIFSLTIATSQTQNAKTDNARIVILYEDGTWIYKDSLTTHHLNVSKINNLEIPKISSKDEIISHTGYSLLYNEAHEQANWVAYELTKEETSKLFERTNKFMPDPLIKTGSARDEDYQGYGYDRGHLAPASDMGYSSITMTESFYYSNMSPQVPSFNRGIWKKLEALVRTWAIENNSIYVVTGPILTKGLETIGPDKVSVPKYYYKVILDYTEPGIKGIGFILPNEGSKENLENFALSIDSVESVTGIDFFNLLENRQENEIEKTLCLNCWSWNIVKSKSSINDSKSTESVRCNGMTKKGERCKIMTHNTSRYCFHHEGQIGSEIPKTSEEQFTAQPTQQTTRNSTSMQCSGVTKAGNRCKRMTTNSNGRCFQH
jgi:endonuclease G, mitochondrial